MWWHLVFTHFFFIGDPWCVPYIYRVRGDHLDMCTGILYIYSAFQIFITLCSVE